VTGRLSQNEFDQTAIYINPSAKGNQFNQSTEKNNKMALE